jgi:hypothetical protein
MKPKQLFRKLKAPILALAVLAFAGAVQADSYTRGYFRRDGSYVDGYWRTQPDGNRYNNYSTEGNINPYTGRRGYKNPSDTDYYLGRPNNNYGY